MANAGQAISGGLQGAASGAALGTALFPGVGTAIGAGLGGLAGALPSIFGGEPDDSEETKALQQQQQAYNDLQVLTPDQRAVQLQYLQSVGKLTPELENAITQQDTNLSKITLDPVYKQAQMNALNKLSQQGKEGLTLEDRSALEDIRSQEAQAAKGRQEAILQNMAARGMGGSGAELAASLQSAQSGADAARQRDLAIAAQAQKNALQATLNSGTLASTYGQNEFNNQKAVQEAQDTINKFNVQNTQAVGARNANVGNQAQAYNLDSAKQVEASRVAAANATALAKSQAMQDYVNALNTKKLGSAGVGVNMGKAKDTTRQQSDAGTAQMVSGIAGIGQTVAQGIKSGAFTPNATEDDENPIITKVPKVGS